VRRHSTKAPTARSTNFSGKVLLQASRLEDVRGTGGVAPPFLTSALDGDEWAPEPVWTLYKVKLSLCLTNYALRHEGVWGSGCIRPHIDLGTSWRWSASRPGRFTPGERAPPFPLVGCWVDPRADLDDVAKSQVLQLI
jgi:hypothetical protein